MAGGCANPLAAVFMSVVLRILLAALAAFFDVAISAPASRDAKGFVEFSLPGLHAMDHEVFRGLMEHDDFDQDSLRREPKYPGPRRIVVDHIVRNVHVLQGVVYVVLGVLALEGRVVDLGVVPLD